MFFFRSGALGLHGSDPPRTTLTSYFRSGPSSGLGRVMGWDARPSTSARAHPGHRWRHHRPCGTRTDACDPCEAAESPPTTSRMPPAPPQKERMKTRRQQQGASFTLSLDVDGDGRAYRDAYRLNIWRRCTMSN